MVQTECDHGKLINNTSSLPFRQFRRMSPRQTLVVILMPHNFEQVPRYLICRRLPSAIPSSTHKFWNIHSLCVWNHIISNNECLDCLEFVIGDVVIRISLLLAQIYLVFGDFLLGYHLWISCDIFTTMARCLTLFPENFTLTYSNMLLLLLLFINNQ